MYLSARFLLGVVSFVLAVFSVFGFSIFHTSGVADQETAASNVLATVSSHASTSMTVAPIPQVVFIQPVDGAQGTVLDIEDPIVVHFDHSVKDFFVDFRLNPAVSVMYQNNPEKTEFKILPKEPLVSKTPYTLQIFMKHRDMDDSTYTLLASSQFTTPEEKLTTEKQSVADMLIDAKQNTVAQIMRGRYIDVSLSRQVMILFENGKPLDAYRVSSGKRGMETPRGQFKIENKTKRAWSKSYGLYMPYWMAITPSGKFGIHELPEWPSGYKEGANHLGIPVSHGCVRLGVGPAQRVFEFADAGTPVIVH